MTFKIAHLYYDLANLYGESGNVTVLTHYLQEQGVDVQVDRLTIGDTYNLHDYDFVYIGASTEKNQALICSDIMNNKVAYMKYVMDGGYLLATNNALELFGKSCLILGKKEVGICLGNYEAEPLEKRLMQEVILSNDELKDEVVGFQNQANGIVKNDTPWFTNVLQGMGAYPNATNEGVKINHFYGSYVVGPLLARNPHVCEYFVEQIMSEKGWAYDPSKNHHKFDEKAYKSYKESIKK